MIVIGATSKNAAGKTGLGKYLETKGFVYTSLSDIVRKLVAAEGKEIIRDHLIEKANAMRAQHGHGILAKLLCEQFDPTKNYFVDSFRHPEEVFEMRKLPCFELWRVEASPQIRFERLRLRGREQDPKTWVDFEKMEEKEANSTLTHGIKLDVVGTLADRSITNESTIDFFHHQIDGALLALLAEKKTRVPL